MLQSHVEEVEPARLPHGGDPKAFLKEAERVVYFLRRLPRREHAILTSPSIAGTNWVEVLEAIRTLVTDSITRDRKSPPPQPPAELPLMRDLARRALDLRRLLGEVIDNNGSSPETSARIRQLVLSRRAPTPHQAALMADIQLILSGIGRLDPAPCAVLAMVPRFEALYEEIRRNPARPGPRPKTVAHKWSPTTDHHVRLGYLALGRALTWGLAVGKDERTVEAIRSFLGPKKKEAKAEDPSPQRKRSAKSTEKNQKRVEPEDGRQTLAG